MIDPFSFFSPEEIAWWADLRQVNIGLSLVNLGLTFAFYIILLASGLHLGILFACERVAEWIYTRPTLIRLGNKSLICTRLVRAMEKLGAGHDNPTRWLTNCLYPAALFFLWVLVWLPFAFATSYVLGYERGMLTITLGKWWCDWGKGLALSAFFYALLGLGLFGLVRKLPKTWWIWLWVASCGVMGVWFMLTPYRAKVYHEFTLLEQGKLRDSISELVYDAGFDVEDIYTVDTSTRSKYAIAYVMGTGPTKRVILGDNLIANFHPREILVTIAHEVGHVLHEHPVRSWFTTTLVVLGFLLLVHLIFLKAPSCKCLHVNKDADLALLPVLLLVLQVLFLFNQPVSAALSRAEEAEADNEALQLTQDPAAFCSLMVRLARINQSDVHPPAWVRWFYMHHPSIIERIQAGLVWAKHNGIHIDPSTIPLALERS